MNGLAESIRTKNTYRVVCLRPKYLPKDPITAAWFMDAGLCDMDEVWREDFNNRVTTVGLNLILTDTLKNGTGSAAWYVGLVGPTQSDGAITSGQATFASAAGAFSAADVGQPITIKGAGAAGADLNTTILSYQSATGITLNANAGTTVSGAAYVVGCRQADTSASHVPWTESVPYSNGTRVTWTGGTVAAGAVDNSGSPAAFTINASATVMGAFLVDNSTKSGTTGNLFGMGPFAASRGVLSGDTLNVTISMTVS